MGGSPATEQIDGGIESLEFNADVSNSRRNARYLSQLSIVVYSSISGDTSFNKNSDTPLGDESAGNTFLDNDEENTELERESNKESGESMKRTVKQRREFLDDKLKNYKQEKMKRKLPVDTQLLGCAQEELKIKRQLVKQMDKMDQRYAENMDKMSRSMEKLTESIADGFALLKQLMMYQQPPPGVYPQPPAFNPYIQGSAHPYSNRMRSYPSSSSSPPSPDYDL